ncbi:beta-mannosidase-like protein [Geopyxis carbonaria]|nr:beta-mannosidase-like protein [Geopyxis carbonaria]
MTELLTIPINEGTWDDVPGAALIPTNIHLDLLRAGRIPDPHVGMAEAEVQWVHEQPWIFRTTFKLPELESRTAHLVFEGLDTYAVVYIDDMEVLTSDNMFLTHRVDVTSFGPGQHSVRIEFDSAMKRGDALLEKHGKRVCWNGHYSRVYVRKAQYHYGWDWGPSLVTCGPWKPVYVEVFSARLKGVEAMAEVAKDLKSATVKVKADIEGTANGTKISVSVAGQTVDLVDGTGSVIINDPKLWWPRGFGEQAMYTVEFKLGDLHTVSKQIGLRRVELVQDALPEVPGNDVSGGSTFYFRINNTPIFCGGSNWIPGDSFQPRITREYLETWLHDLLSKRGNQLMVRIWGGGVYESEDFYEICDQSGIMVWQDVCTACADYPAHLDWFAKSISDELTQNLERLRWHPSLVIVAGNNEDYQVADEEVGYGPSDQSRWREEPFPSRWLYELRYPEIVRKVCNGSTGDLVASAGASSSGVLYWPGSPFGGVDATDRTVGDIHQWNIWGGIQAPYQRYADLGGRFVSEFGMLSHPAISTIKSGFLPASPAPGDFHPQSETVNFHTKAHSAEKRIIPYIHENYRILSSSFTELVYLTQLIQAEAMSYAYRGWRSKWGKRECSGVLVWQMNDVWPASSWAIVDCNRRPKLAFYSISRALKPVMLIARRYTTNPKPNSKVEALASHKTAKSGTAKLHSTPHIYPEIKSTLDLVLSSISPRDHEGLKVVVRYINILTGEAQEVHSATYTAAANATAAVLEKHPVPVAPPTVVHAVLTNSTGDVLASEYDWPAPLKHVHFPDDRGIVVMRTAQGVEVTAERPVKAVQFVEIDGERWGDGGVDVVPGEVVTIVVENWRGGEKEGEKVERVGSGGRRWRAYGDIGVED